MLCWMMVNKLSGPIDRLIVVIELMRSIDDACVRCLSHALHLLLRVYPIRSVAKARALY